MFGLIKKIFITGIVRESSYKVRVVEQSVSMI